MLKNKLSHCFLFVVCIWAFTPILNGQELIPAPFGEDSGSDSVSQETQAGEEKKEEKSTEKQDSASQKVAEPKEEKEEEKQDTVQTSASDAVDSVKVSEPLPKDTAAATSSDTSKVDSWETAMDSTVVDSNVIAAPFDSVQQADKDTLDADSTLAKQPDSLPAKKDSLIIPPVETVKPKAEPKPKKRELAVRSSQVNTIDDMKGRYKSPKKALFMSLVLPGLGQAYVGSYWRAGMYVAIETGLALGWRHYVVTLHDRQVKKYEKYADEHWSHGRYEDYYGDLSLQNPFDGNPEEMKNVAPTREEFCRAVFAEDTRATSAFQTCIDFGPYQPDEAYDLFAFYEESRYERYDDSDPLSADSIGIYRRENFQNIHAFYELLGKHNEYLPGWDDAENIIYTDTSIVGESENRDTYRKMRNRATEYSRMQAGFLGAMVINHLVSALDAALTARFHNKKLYETEVRWWDRVRLDSFVAFEGWYPKSFIQASLPF